MKKLKRQIDYLPYSEILQAATIVAIFLRGAVVGVKSGFIGQ